MKINHVITSLGPGGAEYLTTSLARRQTELGHDVSVYTLFVPDSESARLQIMSREANLRKDGITVEQVGRGPRDGLAAGLRLRQASRRWEARRTVFHAHNAATATAAAIAAGPWPVVVSLHAQSAALRVPRQYWRLLSPRVGAFVAVSSAVQEDFCRFMSAEISMIQNGVAAPAPMSELRRDPQTVRLLAVGRIHEHKNYGRMIRALAAIRKEVEVAGVRFTLDVAGPGAGLEQLHALAQEVGVSDLVTFLGFSDRVPTLLADADVFVMSSDTEGMPIALLEALAAGTACVTTPFPGARGILLEGDAGLVAEDFTDAALASAIKAVLLDRDLRRTVSEGANLRSKDFSIDRCADRYLSVYSALLAE